MDGLNKVAVEDTFVFEVEGIPLFYSPLDQKLLALTPSANKRLRADPQVAAWKRILDPTGSLGLFDEPPPPVADYVSKTGFDGLVFLITNSCNMKCRYCYASKTHTAPSSIDADTWTRTIDHFFDNVDGNCDELGLAFHGYGECSLYPDSIRQITRVFKIRCSAIDKPAKLQITTNGTFDSSFCDFLTRERFFINLSLDGPSDVNDLMRIRQSGQGSFDLVERNIRRIVESNVADQLMIRSTFTIDTVDRMVDAFQFFGEVGVKLVHMEPVYIRGAATMIRSEPFDLYRKFSDNFKRCLTVADELGMKLLYGPMNFGLGSRFCSHQKKLMVDYAGRIVSCVEAGEGAGLEQFCYGTLQAAPSAGVRYDEHKIQWLNSRAVYLYPECADCLLKYHCAGNCPISRIAPDQDHTQRDASCAENERLFAWVLARIMAGETIEPLLDFPLHRVW